MNILITGGAGYVGTVLVPELVAAGHKVTVYDLFLYGDHIPDHENITKVHGDIRDPIRFRNHIAGCDAVIHLACVSNDPSFDLNPELGKAINYDCFRDLLRVSTDASIERFIYASSSSVYGVKDDPQVTEEASREPLTDYSKYKALCEDILLEGQDFCTTILRPATICGYSPRQRFDLVVNILTNQAINAGEVRVFGGAQFRPNIHIKDMVRAYLTVLEADEEKVNGQIFNVGSANLTVSEIANTVRSVVSDGVVLTTTYSDDNRSYRVTSEKIKEVLGFSTEHTVQEAVQDLKDKFDEGAFTNPLTNPMYFNIKRMQEVHL